jgi:predicted dehydrogenase
VPLADPTPDVPAVFPSGRIAVVGAGAFGRFCIAAYRECPDLDVVVVADPDQAALGLVETPDAILTTDWRVVVTRPDVEAVHIAAPPWLRREIVDDIMAAGKSVFCEKPLALTLDEADAMIQEASRIGVALGVDYVMRHHPAFHLLYALAGSNLLGNVRSISLQNFAQAVPPGHWFWDRDRSGGILVEHSVHFFDAYGQVAGPARCVRGYSSRREAVEVAVDYSGGAVGRYYHEFAFPPPVERALGLVFFEAGHVEIDGWIPERVEGAVLAPATSIQGIARSVGLDLEVEEDGATQFSVTFGDRSASYGACIVAGMRDVIRRHRDRAHRMEVPPEDARRSLALALAAQRSIDSAAAGVPVGDELPVTISGDESLQ